MTNFCRNFYYYREINGEKKVMNYFTIVSHLYLFLAHGDVFFSDSFSTTNIFILFKRVELTSFALSQLI